MRLRVAVLVLSLVAALCLPVSAGEQVTGVESCRSVGNATYNPTAVKRLTDAPVSGVSIPADASFLYMTIRSQPVNFLLDANPTATRGIRLPVGTYYFGYDRKFLLAFRMIDTSEGASTVDIQFCARQRM